tara:strand:- start:1706 stop:1966 length:261 start_codon:yes stop_codon:yes gene_type:complete
MTEVVLLSVEDLDSESLLESLLESLFDSESTLTSIDSLSDASSSLLSISMLILMGFASFSWLSLVGQSVHENSKNGSKIRYFIENY